MEETIMASKKVNVEVDVETVRELSGTEPRAEESVFDRSLGVDEGCLSARDLLTLLYDGAGPRELAHLITCQTCLENLRVIGGVRLESEPDFVRRAYANATSDQADAAILRRHRESRGPVTAVLGRESLEVSVPASLEHHLGLEITMVPAFPRTWLEGIDVESLRMDGALVSTQVEIKERVGVDKGGAADYVRLLVVDGVLDRGARDRIAHHDRVNDVVRLHGLFKDRQLPPFTAQMRVELVKDQPRA
jgi:hypothetical protein